MIRIRLACKELVGTPSGIRTRDLYLERVASWAARRWGHKGLALVAVAMIPG